MDQEAQDVAVADLAKSDEVRGQIPSRDMDNHTVSIGKWNGIEMPNLIFD